jgi:hypothetical protein
VWAVAKLEQFEQLLSDMDFGEVLNKTRKLNLPVFQNIPLKFDEMTYGEMATFIRENLLNDLCQ